MRIGILKIYKIFFIYFFICLEAVLVKDCWATYSADLGASSKESYWDYNRGWPKRRKVPCCSLVRRGWVSPKLLAETVLKQLLCLYLIVGIYCFCIKYFTFIYNIVDW